jgi:hypothetical protein
MDPREVRKLPQAEQDRIMSEAAKLVEDDYQTEQALGALLGDWN